MAVVARLMMMVLARGMSEAVLDDRGVGDEDVVLMVHEGEHDAFEFGLGELAVAYDDSCLRD